MRRDAELRGNRLGADRPEYGPFGWSRNPLYLAYVLAVLGCALLGGSWAALICPLACFSVLNWLIIPIEERAMLRAFGEEYGLYRRRVRRWI